MEFQQKIISGKLFRNFSANQGYPIPKHVKFLPIFCNFILGAFCAENFYTCTFICCLHPGKEPRP